jgi:hypothetical protein
MRKIILFILVLGQISFAVAQSLTVTGNTSFTGNLVTQIAHHLDVKNTSANPIIIKCQKTNLTLPAGAESFYCFAGNCYSASATTPSSAATLMAGQQISFNNSPPDADAHSGYYDAYGASGIAEVQYCFYDVNNPTDETCVTITYACFGISYDCVNGACIDPGTGNGTFDSLSVCLNNCLIIPTWDCDALGNCTDPGTGTGVYPDSNTCQAACVVTPTWDCDALGNCIDPGTGTGVYPDSNACQAACITAINEEISNLTEISDFYPNPANGLTHFTFSGKKAQLKIIDILGNEVKVLQLEQPGVKNIDLNDMSKGIYFGKLVINNKVTTIKKLIVN